MRVHGESLKGRHAALSVLVIAALAGLLSGCGSEATTTTVAATTTTLAVDTALADPTTTTAETTTTTEASTTSTTKIELATTSSTLPPGGPGPAKIVASASFDGELYQEDWGPVPCVSKEVTKIEWEGATQVQKTVRVDTWPLWMRLTETNGVAVFIERYGYFHYDAQGEAYTLPEDVGTWHAFDWVLLPHGTYDRNFIPTSEGDPRAAGGAFAMKFEGYDANDNEFEIEVRFDLALP